MQQEQKIIKIDEIREKWDSFVKVYDSQDAAMNTFYYTLVNMLDIPHSKHILEVACGTAKLVPYTLNFKSAQTTYLATDLSPNVIQYAKDSLNKYYSKLGLSKSFQQWMEDNKLTVRAANGEQKIDVPYKFDRIIANLVLMLTEDPFKMMKNLHQMSEDKCLLGVTIWGDKKLSNFLPILDEAMEANGMPLPKIRSNFHLYNKLEQLAEKTGWEIIVLWDQVVPFHFISLEDKNLINLIEHWCRKQQVLIDYYHKRVKELFDAKKTLNFPVQMAILRKK